MIELLFLGALQDAEVGRILQKYEAARPKDSEMSIFRLDWARSWKEAKERAAGEKRPILLLTVQNEHGGLYGGHC